ncbi:MAG TPA: hypothetical protein VJR27_02545 [Candidatus Saccharimonadales bacterium]|nr:hypothetical protein [Candidatus Saccharimonadales bacterium]
MAPEANIPHRVLSNREVGTLLDYVGNHEGKTAVAAIMLSEPSTQFNATDLQNAVYDSQDEDDGWVPKRPIFGNYCTRSLVPSGIVVQEGEWYQAEASPALPQRLAFCGSILGWSLEFPEISVQKVFGQSASAHSRRAPALRYEIFKYIANNPDTELSYGDVWHGMGQPEHFTRGVMNRNIGVLALQGLLEAHVLDVATDVRVQIVDPTFRQGRVPFQELEAETRNTYKAINTLWESGQRVMGFDDLYQQIIALDPQSDPAKVRHLWCAMSDGALNFPGLKRVERAIQDRKKLSVVRLGADHAEAITALLDRLQVLQTEPESIAEVAASAIAICNDRAAMTTIFAKAKHFSACRAIQEEHPERTKVRILELLGETGPLSTKDIAQKLQPERRSLDLSVVRRFINNLVAQGKVVREDIPMSTAATRVVRTYRLPPEA